MAAPLDRDVFETTRVLHCHFCTSWVLHVTDIDRQGDVADAYSTHLVRHGEAADMVLLEAIVWDAIVDDLDD
ncbi:MAG: hypothetical protein JWM64_1538 [Frankiales bacterium]|nr:hypothetical protein [Frankiales bacterium]